MFKATENHSYAFIKIKFESQYKVTILVHIRIYIATAKSGRYFNSYMYIAITLDYYNNENYNILFSLY